MHLSDGHYTSRSHRVHKNQAVPDNPDILRVIFLGSVNQASTVPASKLDQDRRRVLGKRHLLYRLAIAGVPLVAT